MKHIERMKLHVLLLVAMVSFAYLIPSFCQSKSPANDTTKIKLSTPAAPVFQPAPPRKPPLGDRFTLPSLTRRSYFQMFFTP